MSSQKSLLAQKKHIVQNAQITAPVVTDYANVYKNRQYESMTYIECGAYNVRVWSTCDDFTFGPSASVILALKEVLSAQTQPEHVLPHHIACALDKLDEVAAYEILDYNKQGALVYPDWR